MGTDAGFPDPDVINDLPAAERKDRPWTLGPDHIVWLQAMVEKGMSPMDAILAATRNVAKAYGKSEHYGTVEVGKMADLLILDADPLADITNIRSEEHTSELQSLMRISYAVFCLKKKTLNNNNN